jgi:DNA-binding IclR family transcriptional regulator
VTASIGEMTAMTSLDTEPETGSQTLERGLAVLIEISRAQGGMTTSQVAVATGLHRSIARRLLVSLQRTEFAARTATGRYVLGSAATALVDRSRPSLREVTEPVLHRLAAELDATASLVEVVADAAVTVLVAEPPTDGPRFSYRLGNRDPLDRGAGGLAALASGPPIAGEPARVEQVRKLGFATTHAELNPGAFGIAAPLPGWGVRAAINIVTSREALMTEAIEPLRRAVAEVGSGALR